MANSYIQVYIHAVFAVKHRAHIISPFFKDRLRKYTSAILKEKKHIPVAVHYMSDHAHILFGLNANDPLSAIIRDVKANTSRFINESKEINERFEWQTGYGAFGCGRRDLNLIAAYVNNQEQHHFNRHFKQEMLELLEENAIEYDPKYLFEWIE